MPDAMPDALKDKETRGTILEIVRMSTEDGPGL